LSGSHLKAPGFAGGYLLTTNIVSPLRQRMIEDMNARNLCAGTQRGHIRSCKRFAAFLKRSPDTATFEDIRRFQLHLAETGVSICNRNAIMTGLRFLFRVTRLDLATEIYHLRQPQTIPLATSANEAKRLLAVAESLKARVLLSLSYGCGLRAGEVVRLKVKHIDSAQRIIRIEQSKGRNDRNVMLSPAMLDLLRQWWKVRPSRYDAGLPVQERWLFPSRKTPGRPMATRHLNRIFHEMAEAAGIKKSVTRHALRDSFATHLLEPAHAARAVETLLRMRLVELPRGEILEVALLLAMVLLAKKEGAPLTEEREAPPITEERPLAIAKSEDATVLPDADNQADRPRRYAEKRGVRCCSGGSRTGQSPEPISKPQPRLS